MHCKFAPSAAFRWTNCPGSLALGEYANKLYPKKQNVFAESGSNAHDAIDQALCLSNTSPLDALPEDEQYAAQMYLDYVTEIATKCDVWASEQRLSAKIGDEEIFGTADFFGIAGNTLYVIDYKHGKFHEVEIHENKQLLLYAILALEMHQDKEIDFVHTAIVQPRAETFDPIKEQIYDAPTLLTTWYPVYNNAIKRAKLNPDMCVKGDWCKWCDAQPVCPELNKNAFALAKPEIMDTLAKANDAKLASILFHEKAILELFSRAKELMKTRMMNGAKIPGWKLVESRTHKRWKNEAEALDFLKWLDVEELVEEKPVSPSKALKILEDVDLSEYIEKPYVLTIAPEDDKRQAVDIVDVDFEKEF